MRRRGEAATKSAQTMQALSRVPAILAISCNLTDELVLVSSINQPPTPLVTPFTRTYHPLHAHPRQQLRAIYTGHGIFVSCHCFFTMQTLTSVQLALMTVLKCAPTLPDPSPVAVRTTSTSTRMAGHALVRRIMAPLSSLHYACLHTHIHTHTCSCESVC